MQKKSLFTTLVITAVAVAGLSTAALADRGHGRGAGDGPMGGPADGPMPMLNFEMLDADKDGKITPAELNAERAARVAKADANGDGKMSVEELAAMELERMTAMATARAQGMVARMDSDGDGLLSAAELAAGPSRTPIFAHVDTDGDGAISQAEADAMKARMQDRMGKRGGAPRP
ncbi:EF-hand domain-containing protein [Paracoccaceae bacterium Fryx2]|nr:EF-hand domain-containing protein [Paracoccaceae bacterium Fryx2]